MSNQIKINTTAPDFELNDFSGRAIRLSTYQGKNNIVLVFNRGFF
jgi:peroxiredoxin